MEGLERVYRTSFNSTNDSSPLVSAAYRFGGENWTKIQAGRSPNSKGTKNGDRMRQLRFFREVACRAETEIIWTGPQTNV